MEQDSCPCSAHPHPSPTSSPPHPPPPLTYRSSQPVDPSDKEGGRGEAGDGGGGQPKSRRRGQSRERPHRQQKGGFLLSQHPLSHKVTDSERSLAE